MDWKWTCSPTSKVGKVNFQSWLKVGKVNFQSGLKVGKVNFWILTCLTCKVNLSKLKSALSFNLSNFELRWKVNFPKLNSTVKANFQSWIKVRKVGSNLSNFDSTLKVSGHP